MVYEKNICQLPLDKGGIQDNFRRDMIAGRTVYSIWDSFLWAKITPQPCAILPKHSIQEKKSEAVEAVEDVPSDPL